MYCPVIDDSDRFVPAVQFLVRTNGIRGLSPVDLVPERKTSIRNLQGLLPPKCTVRLDEYHSSGHSTDPWLLKYRALNER